MLREFYNYLAKRIKEYFSSVQISNGDRFNIEFEKKEDVEALYKEIEKLGNIEKFIYKAKSNSNSYETYTINAGNTKVIIAATSDDVTVDFLTTLRNKVGTKVDHDDQFGNTAILFIHHIELDSILGGAISFTRKGMPFHIKSITKDIYSKIKESQLSKVDQCILAFDLNNRKEQYFEEDQSLFQYREILEAINKERIDKKDYKKFNIFPDAQLSDNDSKDKIEGRLKPNNKAFLDIDDIHKYKNPENDLHKILDEEGVKILKRDDWEEIDYIKVKKSIDNKKNDKKIEYEGMVKTELGIDVWEKEEASSPTKQRIRNIIVFNKNKLKYINLYFQFDEHIRQANISNGKNQEAQGRKSGKKLEVVIEHEIGKVSFSTIKYHDKDQTGKTKAKFEFKILVLDLGKEDVNCDLLETNFNIYMKKKETRLLIRTQSSEIIFNPEETEFEELNLSSNEEIIVDSINKKIIIRNDMEADENTNFVPFDLRISSILIPMAIEDESDKSISITSLNVWKMKREEKSSFKYRNCKLIFGNKEYYARDGFRDNLEREQKIIDSEGMFFIEEDEDQLIKQDLEIDIELKNAYLQLINYYKINKLLLSLSYYDDELITLSKNYVDKYIEAIEKIPEGIYIEKELHKNLIKIGCIKKEYDEKEVLLTPLHPLNVMYQLKINEEIQIEKLNDEMIKKLDSLYLMPYLIYECEEDHLYKPVEQTHSLEWKYYIKQKVVRYKSSRKFISKLVKAKVEEFIKHFSYMFSLSNQAAIKLNLIHTGDCKEILQGIVDYYVEQLNKNKKIEDVYPIDVNIYSNEDYNVFEQISFYNTPEEIKEHLDIEFKSTKNYSKEDLLNAYREKVHFYKKNPENPKYNYCHVAFYEMDQSVGIEATEMKDITTGVSLEGIASGAPSKFLGDKYRTGFGTKYLKNNNKLLDLSIKLNGLISVIHSSSHFKLESCITTSISHDRRKALDKIYDSSHWVTFIDPKVDLHFFKNDENAKNVLIIHYNDQYTSSSGYDAITVTRKSEHYRKILKDFLERKGSTVKEEDTFHVINCFNAINGDWLLSLISNNGQSPREKLSIISAVKISLAYFHHKNIIWVPVSLEEILRVSGGAGLSSKEGLFSVKNLKGDGKGKGPYSDDLLLVGIENNDGDIKVYYYPIEVKIGKNESGVKNKAEKQVYKTRKLLEDFLIEKDQEDDPMKFAKKMYRNFMMQIAIVSAEKMKLYDLWKEQDWDQVINSEVRTKLLNEEYTISKELDTFIGRGAIISFKDGCYFSNNSNMREENDEKFLEIELSEEAGYRNIISNVEELKDKYISGNTDFVKENLLYFNYKADTNDENNDQEKSQGQDHGKTEITTRKNKEQTKEKEVEKEENRPIEILFGSNGVSGREVKWYPTNTSITSHINTGIIGTMGTGKTQFTKSLITQLYKESQHNLHNTKMGILIFDYNGEYLADKDFVRMTNANTQKIFKLQYNPLSLYLTDKEQHMLPVHTAELLSETILNAFNLGNVQQDILMESILNAYAKKGIDEEDHTTWTKVAPTIYDVYEEYNKFREENNLKADSLSAAFNRLIRFKIFEKDVSKTKPLFELIDGVTIIDLSGNAEEIQNLVVAITLDVFYTQMQLKGQSRIEGDFRELTNLILVDEADNFMRGDFKPLKKILKEGRKYGVGTILSTQFLSHFRTKNNDYAKYILTWVMHNVADLNSKEINTIFNLDNKNEEQTIFNKIKSLEKHYSLVKFGHEDRPVYMKDKAFWELAEDIK